MRFIGKFFKNLIVTLLNIVISVLIVYWNVVTIMTAFQTPGADWNKVWTYVICSAVILVFMWMSAILKFLKRLVYVVITLLLSLWIALSNMFPGINDNLCITFGSCKAGQEVLTVKGKMVIDKNTCAQNGWRWVDDKNICETKVKK